MPALRLLKVTCRLALSVMYSMVNLRRLPFPSLSASLSAVGSSFCEACSVGVADGALFGRASSLLSILGNKKVGCTKGTIPPYPVGKWGVAALECCPNDPLSHIFIILLYANMVHKYSSLSLFYDMSSRRC